MNSLSDQTASAKPEPSPRAIQLTRHVLKLLKTAEQAITDKIGEALRKADITWPLYNLLQRIREGQMTMSDISKVMFHSTAAATGTVDRLERLGYVQRIHGKTDRRSVHVDLTQKGIRFLAKLDEIVATIVRGELDDCDSSLNDAVNSLAQATQKCANNAAYWQPGEPRTAVTTTG